MSPWLFNLYMDGVVREVNARVLGRGLKLVDGNENEWELNQLLFADDTVVVADSEKKLCQLVTEFGRVCERSARGRPRFGWIDGVKRALNDRRMDIRAASERSRNRNEWRMIVTQF